MAAMEPEMAFTDEAGNLRLNEAGRDAIARELAYVAIAAGKLIRDITARGVVASEKPDGSACTDADVAAERLIVAELARRFPGVAVVGEETASAASGPLPALFFLVDPIDGTSEFVAGGDGYTVNIALIHDGAPIAGVILAPAQARAWTGGATAHAADAVLSTPAGALAWRPLHTRPTPEDGLVALASARHGDAATEAWLARMPVSARRNASSSLKFCVIAAGEADVYPRFGRTMEWDTAAGQAVLTAAGGVVTEPDGRMFRYGDWRGGFANGPFIAWGDPLAALTHAGPKAGPGREA